MAAYDLMVLDDKTKLPTINPALFTIKCFYELWRRRKKVDGDATGEQKKFNLKELAYVFFTGKYDSRFKWDEPEIKHSKIVNLVDLPEDWRPDDIVKDCINEWMLAQVTASSELVFSLEGGAHAVSKYLRTVTVAISTGTILTIEPKQVKEVMDIMDRAPSTIDNVKKARAVLEKEQNSLSTGRKDRLVNKFELVDKKK